MKSLLGSVLVIAICVVSFRSVHAEPPPAMEDRDIKKVIAVLKDKTALAAVRYDAEVFGAKTISAPVGSPPDSLGAWSENTALAHAERAIESNVCASLDAAQAKSASALLKTYGTSMPLTLRAYTLGQEGKTKEAADGFAQVIAGQTIKGECPGEHPMYSHQRVWKLQFAMQCLKVFDPKRDVTREQKVLERAQACASTNRAVG